MICLMTGLASSLSQKRRREEDEVAMEDWDRAG